MAHYQHNPSGSTNVTSQREPETPTTTRTPTLSPAIRQLITSSNPVAAGVGEILAALAVNEELSAPLIVHFERRRMVLGRKRMASLAGRVSPDVSRGYPFCSWNWLNTLVGNRTRFCTSKESLGFLIRLCSCKHYYSGRRSWWRWIWTLGRRSCLE